MLVLVGEGLTSSSLTGSLGLEKLFEGNTGNQKNLHLIFIYLFIYLFMFRITIEWTYVMPVLVGEKYRQLRKGFTA